MPKNILVVEDERLVAQHISTLLSDNGYQVCAIASDGSTALKKVAEHRPDLVLLDIRIKGELDGIEVAEQITKLYDSLIVYLTAFSDRDTLKRAQATHPAGYVVKPFRQEQLLSTMAIALGSKQSPFPTSQEEVSPVLPQHLADSRLQKVLVYIEEHFNEGISINFLASAINMTPAYFCRYFQKEMGCSPYQFMIRKRIDRAMLLLQERELSISDIAEQCGFSSHSQLTRHFRKVLGITPKEYRNM